MNKTDFDNKIISYNKIITSNKTKYLEVQINFLNRSQNTFVYQQALDMLEVIKNKGTDNVFSWKSKRLYNSKVKLLYTVFLHGLKLSG